MDIDIERLKREQINLSKKLILKDEFKSVETIAGIDQAYVGENVISCIIVCNAKTLEIVEEQTAAAKALMTYKPGFLAYRELPPMVEAYNKLKTTPDIIMVDGNGIAHPRGLGIASHFGLAINKPTIGIASNLMLGRVEKGKLYIEKSHVGFEVVTTEHASPIYISPGHLISIGTALKVVRDSLKPPHKMPEPLHWAHRGARREMKRIVEEKEKKDKDKQKPLQNKL